MASDSSHPSDERPHGRATEAGRSDALATRTPRDRSAEAPAWGMHAAGVHAPGVHAPGMHATRELDTPAHATAPRQLAPGDVIDERYRLLDRIGRGGMGEVFLARHLITQGTLAIKLLHAREDPASSRLRRFRDEARHAAALSHPNTVRVSDFGVDDGVPYLVMEHVAGESLQAVIDRAPLPWPRVVRIARQILNALSEAHTHRLQIVHRDIKPGNVLLVQQPGHEDFVKVLDFGIARALAIPGPQERGLLGSPATMAPEQWREEDVGPRTDLYALGCTLFIALCGEAPFFAASPLALGRQHIEASPPLHRIEHVPAPLVEWLATLLAKAPAHRPPSARSAREALDEAVARCPRGDVASPLAPRDPGGLVGRGDALAAIGRALVGSRVVLLHGPGGVGKTTLALAVGSALRERFPAGVHFCGLAGVSPGDVAHALARQLGIAVGTRALEAVADAVVSARRLVVLDNAEHVSDEVARVLAAILAATGEGRVLVTSQHRVALPEVAHIELGALPVPAIDAGPDEIAASPAVKLFLLRAGRSDTLRGDAQMHKIGELVRALDGLPLAIELAAARLSMITLDDLAQRLGERFRLLRDKRGAHPERHATLRATIAWSWQLLSTDEQRALAVASVFEDGFSLHDLEGVLETTETDPLDLLEALVGKSLVRTERGPGVRHRLLESVRHFAADRLAEMGELGPRIRDRHALWYASRWGRPESIDALRRASDPDEGRRLHREWADALRATRHAAKRALESGSVELWRRAATGLALALGHTATRCGPLPDGAVVLSTARRLDLAPAPRLDVLLCLAGVHWSAGDFAGAAAVADEARALAATIGTDEAEARVALLARRPSPADVPGLERALAVAERLGDPDLRAEVHYQLGYLALGAFDYPLAAAHYAASIRVASAAENRFLAARASHGLAIVQLDAVSPEAHATIARARALMEAIDDNAGLSSLLLGIGDRFKRLRDPERARSAFLEARALGERTGRRNLAAHCALRLGLLAWSEGALDDAARHFEVSATLAARIDEPGVRARASALVGKVCLERGHLGLARRQFELARRVVIGDPDEADEIGYADAHLAAVALAEVEAGARDVAALPSLVDQLRDAVARLADGYPRFHAFAQGFLARALALSGEREHAVQVLDEALETLRRHHDDDEVAVALTHRVAIEVACNRRSAALGALARATEFVHERRTRPDTRMSRYLVDARARVDAMRDTESSGAFAASS